MKMWVLIGFALSLEVSAAIKGGHKDDLSRYRSEVMQLGARLTSLEKEIGSKNDLYISSVEQIKQFEKDIAIYKENLAQVHSDVRAARDENKRILQSYLIESESEGTEPWQKKVHLELLKQAQTKLKNKEEELISFENKVAEFDLKLASLKQNEEELAQVIKELEARKQVAMGLYLEKVKNKKLAETKVYNQRLSNKINQIKKVYSNAPIVEIKPDRLFKKPLDDFSTYTASAKGVTFKYNSIQPVKAVGVGKVVFAGDLASYGQVVLIDHGMDLRTVILGKMDIKVKKNDSVKDGDVLAYTQKLSNEDQNLYFEVRKKNTAQNTILWLDPHGVSKI